MRESLREAGIEPAVMSSLDSESDEDDQPNISHVLHLLTYLLIPIVVCSLVLIGVL